MIIYKRGNVSSRDYLTQSNIAGNRRSVDVVDLIKKAKFEEKKEKRQTIVIAAAALSALAISGLIITL